MPYIKRSGVKIYYESYGDGPAIVFLHPITTNRYIWANQLFTFAREYRVIVVDHRGHGLSDKPVIGYAISEMASDLIAVFDDAGIDKAVLVGNSLGGMIALQTSLDAPDRVVANFIVSSGTNVAASIPPEAVRAYFEKFEEACDYMVQGGTSAATKHSRSEVCEFLASAIQVKDNFTRAVFLANIEDPNGVFNWDITDRLKDIHQPTLVLVGEEDRAFPLGACQLLAEGIPNGQIKSIPNVGHYYQLEQPSNFNDDLYAFLKKFT